MGPKLPSTRWRAELRLFEFTSTVTDLGWGATCDLDGHMVRIEPGTTGWRVTSTRTRDGLLHDEDLCTAVDAAAEAAVEMVLDIDLVLALEPHLGLRRAA